MTGCLLVDFDGTMTSRDTTQDLICALLMIRPWRMVLVSYYFFRLVCARNEKIQHWKNKMIGKLLVNLSPEKLNKAMEFYRFRVIPLLRKNLIEYLYQCKVDGRHILVVTASPVVAVSYCLAHLPFDVIGTEFMRSGDRYLESPLLPICYGDGKVFSIYAWIAAAGKNNMHFDEAWSDSLSDIPMMKMAQKKIWICDKSMKSRIYQLCQDAVFWDDNMLGL